MRPGLPLVFATILLCGKSVAGSAPLEIIDLFPGFLQCFDISPVHGEEMSSQFSQRLLQAYPEVYRRPTLFRTDPGTLKNYLDQVVVYLPAIKKISYPVPKRIPAG
jgi:hypothetical protein